MMKNPRTRHGAYIDIYQAIEDVKQRVPSRVVIAWEHARVAELPALQHPTVDTVRDYMNRVLDFLYAVDQDTAIDVSRWDATIESLLSELEDLEDPGDDYDAMKAWRATLHHMVASAASAHEHVQRDVSQQYHVDPRGWSDAADDLRAKSARVCLSQYDMSAPSRTVLSERDIVEASHEMDAVQREIAEVRKTVNTIPASILQAWREAHSALSDVMFLAGTGVESLSDIEKVETFGQTTLKFIELTEQMFPDDQLIKDQLAALRKTLRQLEDVKQYATQHEEAIADEIMIHPFIRKIDFILDTVHIHVSRRTQTVKDSWYYTDPVYLKRRNITPTQQAEWELVRKRRGPRQLFMEELWQDVYKRERGASRRKSAAQLCAALRRRAGTVIQFDPKLEKDKKELLGIVDEIIKTYADIYEMSSVVFHALQALATSPDMPTHAPALRTVLTHLQHSIEQLGETR